MRKVNPLLLETEHRRVLGIIAATQNVPKQVRKRAYILLYKADGFSDYDIAEMLDISRITVRRWINRYEDRSSEDTLTQLLDVSKGRGRTDNLSDAEKDWIFSVIGTMPEIHEEETGLWNVKALRNHISGTAEKAGHEKLKKICYHDVYRMVDLYSKRPWAHVKY